MNLKESPPVPPNGTAFSHFWTPRRLSISHVFLLYFALVLPPPHVGPSPPTCNRFAQFCCEQTRWCFDCFDPRNTNAALQPLHHRSWGLRLATKENENVWQIRLTTSFVTQGSTSASFSCVARVWITTYSSVALQRDLTHARPGKRFLETIRNDLTPRS